MSKPKPAISLSAPAVVRKTRPVQPLQTRSRHTTRLDAEKKAMVALEHSLKLQTYTIRMPRSRPLFSGKDSRRSTFSSLPAVITRIQNDR